MANPGVGPHVKQTVTAYQENQVLNKFYTTLCNKPNVFSNHLPVFNKQIQRRKLEKIESFNVKSISRYEILRMLSTKVLPPTITDLIWEWGELVFDRWVAAQLNTQIQWIHGYEHCSLATLQQSKKLGIKSFYEQPSQHYSFFAQIAKNQLKKYPELRSLETALLINQKSERRNQRRAQELEICDYIICNSTFTATTLKDAKVDPGKIITVPLAFPDPAKFISEKTNPTKTIFLYVGNQSLRKGTHLLYRAWQSCNFKTGEAELWMVGSNQLPLKIRAGLGDEVKFMQNMAQTELMKIFAQANVLVLPTLCDGFGMVITEAMAQGLPIITTYASGGPDIISEGKNGFLLEAGNVEQLAAKLKWCLENKKRLQEMGVNALEKAASYPWASFRKRLINEITSRIDPDN